VAPIVPVRRDWHRGRLEDPVRHVFFRV